MAEPSIVQKITMKQTISSECQMNYDIFKQSVFWKMREKQKFFL